MKHLLLSLCTLLTLSVSAQNFLIRHDLIKEKTEFFKINRDKDTVKVDAINLKKAASIKLEVENYNPFYWNAKVTTYKRPVEEQVGFGAVFSPFMGLMKTVMGTALPNLQLPDLGSRGADEPARLEEKFLFYSGLLTEKYQTLRNLEAEYERLKLLELQLTELKYENKKTELEIKSKAQELMLKNMDVSNLDLTQVLAMGKEKDMTLQNTLDSIPFLQEKIQKLSTSMDAGMRISGQMTVSDMVETASSVRKASSNISFGMARADKPFTEELYIVSRLFKDISTTPFRYQYVVNSEPDVSELKLEVYPKIDSLSKDTIVKYFPVTSRGNVRVRGSFGVAFSFFPENKEYFVGPDQKITESTGDLFVPVLSTLINFYPARAGGLKIGGAFGFGIPLQGQNKDINFLLGPSFIIGQNELVIITAGVTGGKINKLSGGWSVGDKVPSASYTLPTKSYYDLGAFICLSFNFSNLSIGKKKSD